MGIEENKVILQRYFDEVINGQDYSRINELMDEDFVGDNKYRNLNGKESQIVFMKRLHDIFSDAYIEIIDMIAEGDKVVALGRWHLTHTGVDYQGLPPTGKSVVTDNVAVYSFKNEKLISGKIFGNPLNIVSQLGYVPEWKTKSELVRKGYDIIASRYMSERDQFNNDKYLEKLDILLKPGSTILDLGCGGGKPVDQFLVDRGHQVTGIDLSSKMIELAQKYVPEASYLVKDISELKRGEYKVDAVVSFSAIIHIPRENHRELFTKINSFLPKGGLILATLGKGDNEEEIGDFYGVEMYWSHYGPEQSRRIIEEAGFEVIIDEIDGSGEESYQIFLARKTG